MNADLMATFLATPEVSGALEQLMVAAAPDEGCAIVVRGQGGLRLVPAENLASTLHAADPEAFPRDARTAFALDVRVIVAEHRAGNDLVAIVHSHVEVGAYFSDEDRRGALTPDGEAPLWPGVRHVVVDVAAGRMRGWRIYGYAAERRDFIELARSTHRDD